MPKMQIDPAAFRKFEKAGWERKSAAYEERAAELGGMLVGPLLTAAAIRAGDRVLDVATGPGWIAAGAHERHARVIGVDLAESMVAIARRRYPEVDFRIADAEDLPFPDAMFDVVVCNLGLPSFPRPELAVAEMARATRAGGRVALTTHDLPAASALVGILARAMAEVAVVPPGDVPVGPDIFHYATDAALAGLLRTAGLTDVGVQTVRFSNQTTAAWLWDTLLASTVRVAAVVERQPPNLQLELRSRFNAIAETYRFGHGIEIPIAIKLAAGMRS